jgi:MoaA/NifB/PqqE/SkfB family radical SAM enzyme
MPTAVKQDFRVGLIGGEPTLHPQFKEILNIINNFCSLTKSSSIIFTNGLLINKFLHLIGEDMALLINVNKL